MYFRVFCLPIVGLTLLFGGCSRQKPTTANYAKRAYLKQQQESASPSPFPQEDRVNDVVLDVANNSHSQWKKQSYETLDDWILRLNKTLVHNQSELTMMKDTYQSLKDNEISLSDSIQKLTEKNNLIRAELQDKVIKEKKQISTQYLTPPFNLYLVRKGDTLYSIANKFYKTSKVIPDIMDWNRGWIRYPNQIQAGTPIVLYNSPNVKKGSVKVFDFIQLLDELRKEEPAVTD